MRRIEDLIDLDLEFYRRSNVDLATFTDGQLIDHYFEHGYREGRASSAIAVRGPFVEQFIGERTLEIGPFYSPTIVGDFVDYADHLTTEELRTRAVEIGMDPTTVPHVAHVLTDGSLGVIRERYDVVFSSHNIEHQPDVIDHLNQVSGVLADDGCFALIVPNARFCFDADLGVSKLSDVLDAYHEGRRRHSLGAVVEHRAMTTHNDSELHWADSLHGRKRYVPVDVERVAAAIREFELADGAYVDVHGWQFDPLSLSDILHCLIDLRVIDFSRVACNGPVFGTNEFTVTLFK